MMVDSKPRRNGVGNNGGDRLVVDDVLNCLKGSSSQELLSFLSES